MQERAIKILRIIARMNIGGPAVQISTLMRELPPDEFQQLLVYGHCEVNEIDYLESNEISVPSIRLRHLGRSISVIQDFLAFLAIWRLIRKFQPDILHTHTFKAGLLGRIATFPLRNRPVVMHTFHGHLLQGYFGVLKTRLVIYTERFLSLLTDVLIAVGERVKQELLAQRIGSPPKYIVIRPGFDFILNQSLNRSQLGIPEDEFVSCWVGRLTDINKPNRILEIAKDLDSNGIKNVTFLIVGDGELRKSVEKEAVRNSLPIKFVGWQSNSVDYIAISDILISTSENEGTPIALIEAQQLGKPVIATDVGSVSEVMIANESGFLLDYDAKEFSKRILLLKESQNTYEKFSIKAKVFAKTQFSAETFVSHYKKLYKDSLNL
jgi:glycosyltransferase involved in cell wall biosynthesis